LSLIILIILLRNIPSNGGRNLKRSLLFLLFVVILLLNFFSGTALALPEITAKSAILIDGASGRVLYEQNAHERLPQASTTKITTALVALENAKLTDRIYIPYDFINPGESSIYLEPGEVHTLEDLMYSLLLKSANDAGDAIAIGVAGSVEKFLDLMNQKVRDLGLKNTHYANTHGLHHEDHYSSAYDLAMITREVIQHNEFRKIITTKRHTLPWAGNEYQRVVYNGNKLLNNYEGADGVKTGYTRQAGSCLVGSATRNGMQLIAVVLNCNNMYDEVAKLLDYGFQNYQKKDFFYKHQVVQEIIVKGGKEEKIKVLADKALSIALTEEELAQAEQSLYLPEEVKAPVKKGQRMGAAVIKINDKITLTTELIASHDVEKRSFFSSLWYKICGKIFSFST
jgi:D-alanyl-D-alanine carboxypeptidase (penicillin-binding protein 5/6)